MRTLWDWRFGATEACAAAIIALRTARARRGRLAWRLIGAAFSVALLGDAYRTGPLVHGGSPHVHLSAASGVYLATYPLLYAGLVLLVRARGAAFPINVWLDGVLSAVGLATIAAVFVLPDIVGRTSVDGTTVAIGMAPPICDTVMLGLIVFVMYTGRWRPLRSWLLLLASAATWLVGDVLLLCRVADNSYVRGSFVDLFHPAAFLLVALASRRETRPTATAAKTGWLTLAVPGGFGAAALALVLYDHLSRIGTVGLILAGATVLLVIVRLVVTFHEYLELLDDVQQQAFSDALTRLGNRRALARDLHAILQVGAPRSALVLLDLDGFKGYNDAFGHPEGDVLLQRLAGRLLEAGHGGHVYRMGGDEFCVVAPLGDRDARALGQLCARALGDRGTRHEITSSYGLVVVPDEAANATDAIRLADQRLYQYKGTGRRANTSQTIDVLVRVMQARERAFDQHGASVAVLAAGLAAACGLHAVEVEQVRHAANLQDLGTLALPYDVLCRPGPLDDRAWQLVRRHPELGQEMLGDSSDLAPIGALVRASHERFDGSGYPDQLAGTQIPLGARIIALCSSYHAMVSDRGHRTGLTHEEAVDELYRCAGTRFDPDLLEPFLRVCERTAASSSRGVLAPRDLPYVARSA
jgi:diguanylate cyclase (GGDEF)-like protein